MSERDPEETSEQSDSPTRNPHPFAEGMERRPCGLPSCNCGRIDRPSLERNRQSQAGYTRSEEEMTRLLPSCTLFASPETETGFDLGHGSGVIDYSAEQHLPLPHPPAAADAGPLTEENDDGQAQRTMTNPSSLLQAFTGEIWEGALMLMDHPVPPKAGVGPAPPPPPDPSLPPEPRLGIGLNRRPRTQPARRPAADRREDSRKEILSKLERREIQPILEKYMAGTGRSVADIYTMSLNDLRWTWRVVHRRWHSAERHFYDQMGIPRP